MSYSALSKLGEFLSRQSTFQFIFSFEDIETIMGEKLPLNARKAHWWSNIQKSKRAQMWLSAGYMTIHTQKNLHQTVPCIEFIKINEKEKELLQKENSILHRVAYFLKENDVIVIISFLIMVITTVITINQAMTGFDNVTPQKPEISLTYDEQMRSIYAEIKLDLKHRNQQSAANEIINLVERGNTEYRSRNYELAGRLFEKAVEIGGSGIDFSLYFDKCIKNHYTAKINLAYMLRRNEYHSYAYEVENLLVDAINSNDAAAYINYALLLTEKNEWEQADLMISKVGQAVDLSEAVNFWESLMSKEYPEGYLVMGWLLRYKLIQRDSMTFIELFDIARESYDLPDWIYERA